MLKSMLIIGAVAFAAVSCGSHPVSEQSSLNSQQKSELVLPFVLACSPANGGTLIRSARLLFDGSNAELRLDTVESEKYLSSVDSTLRSATLDSIDVSWPADQISFKAVLERGRVFKGELTQGNDVVQLNCYKIVTGERDSDEFTLACIPVSVHQASIEGLQLTVRDVVLSWEDSGLEMIVNPSLESLIYDFERANSVQISEQVVSATWNLEQASFFAESLDGIRFEGQLTYEGHAAIPLICWKM